MPDGHDCTQNTVFLPNAINRHLGHPMTMPCAPLPKYAASSMFMISYMQTPYDYYLYAAGRADAGESSMICAAACRCRRILWASVPSSGDAASLNHACCRACLAVMRSLGSYMNIFFSRSKKFLQNLLLSGMMSFSKSAQTPREILSRTYFKFFHSLHKPS